MERAASCDVFGAEGQRWPAADSSGHFQPQLTPVTTSRFGRSRGTEEGRAAAPWRRVVAESKHDVEEQRTEMP